MTGRWQGLAARTMIAQILVIFCGAITLLVTAFLVAPGLFNDHLARTGETDPATIAHAEEAFAVAFSIALPVGALAALLAAGAVSWFLVRRLAQPIEQLATAADAIAIGQTGVAVPDGGFSTEVQQLSASFAGMAQRLADVDAGRARMLADLAHELRTPLATLEAYLEGMQDGIVPLDDESWQTALEQIERLRRLSNDVRQVAEAQEQALRLRPEPVDMTALAATVVALVEPRATACGVTVGRVEGPNRARVMADPDRIGQVLGNLLDNAIRHTPTGGHIVVEVGEDHDEVTISVADSGPGIPAEQHDAIFDRFHRGDPARTFNGSGSGLGLTIARAIVVQHGGRLEASNSAAGRGARFTITLPRLVPQPLA